MDWLTSLIKHVSVSKVMAFAFLCTSSFLLFSTNYIPNLFDPLSGLMEVGAWSVFIYSFVILIVPVMGYLWESVLIAANTAFKVWRGRKITEKERLFIDWAATKGYAPINLNIEMKKMRGIKQIEMLLLVKKLDKKGVVEISPHDETIFWLTSRGRVKALSQKIDEESNANA